MRAAGPRLCARPCGAVVPRAATSTARCLCLTSDRDAQVSPNWPAPLRTGNLAPRPLPRAGGWPSHLDTLCGRAGSVACRGGGARALQSVRPQAKNRLTGESCRRMLTASTLHLSLLDLQEAALRTCSLKRALVGAARARRPIGTSGSAPSWTKSTRLTATPQGKRSIALWCVLIMRLITGRQVLFDEWRSLSLVLLCDADTYLKKTAAKNKTKIALVCTALVRLALTFQKNKH